MTLDRFIVFATVAKRRSVTQAAEELHLSQPAVTKHLKALEKDCNAKLYRRMGRGIELTETGRSLFRELKAILKRYERLKESFGRGADPSRVDGITVGGSYSPSVELLPFALAAFKKQHPNVQVNLRTDNRVAIERAVLKCEVDIAVINNAAMNHSLVIEPYRSEPLIAFVSRNHPLASKKKWTWQDLERNPFIIRKPIGGRGTAEQLFHSIRATGRTLNIAMRCELPAAVKAAVKRKMGVGILFKETIEPEVKSGEFKIVKLPVKRFNGKSFIVYRKDRPLSKTAQDFLDLLHRRRQKPAGRQTKAKLLQDLTEDI